MVSSEEINQKLKMAKYGKLVCKNCGGVYELKSDESPNDYDKCHCGGELVHHYHLPDLVDKRKQKKQKKELENNVDVLMSKPINPAIRKPLEKELKQMVKNGESFDDIEDYYQKTVSKTKLIEDRRNEYIREAKLADQVYKAYITDGLSRLEKVNGRFLASLSIKNDIIIEQNNRIIQLLELIANNGDNSNTSTVFCPNCGTENDSIAKYCSVCGNQIK